MVLYLCADSLGLTNKYADGLFQKTQMGFRFFSRIGGRTGWGLNVSSSGLSSSYRTKYGSFGSKGFSLQTGIPGLTFRSGWGSRGNRGNGALIILVIMVSLFLIYVGLLVAYNLILLLIWVITELYKLCMRLYYRYKEKQALKLEAQFDDSNGTTI